MLVWIRNAALCLTFFRLLATVNASVPATGVYVSPTYSTPTPSSPTYSTPTYSSPTYYTPTPSSPTYNTPYYPVVVACYQSWVCITPCSCSTNSCTAQYKIYTSPQNGGRACTYPANKLLACTPTNCPVNCVGCWSLSTCSVTCGTGIKTASYVVKTPALNGGLSCSVLTGSQETLHCEMPAACPIKKCTGSYVYGACAATCGKSIQVGTYVSSGSECSVVSGTIRNRLCEGPPCPIDCVGTFDRSTCSASCGLGTLKEVFKISRAAANNGVACAFANNFSRNFACHAGVPCACKFPLVLYYVLRFTLFFICMFLLFAFVFSHMQVGFRLFCLLSVVWNRNEDGRLFHNGRSSRLPCKSR